MSFPKKIAAASEKTSKSRVKKSIRDVERVLKRVNIHISLCILNKKGGDDESRKTNAERRLHALKLELRELEQQETDVKFAQKYKYIKFVGTDNTLFPDLFI